MELLILGGPRFLGRHLVTAALGGGHRVALFNRGRTEPELFPEVEKLRGDRAGDLSALEGRTWDAVIDTRDLADWIVRLAEGGVPGTFTATGPDYPLTMEGLLDACRDAASSDARFTWVDEAFLVENQAGPWEELPMWVPETTSTSHLGILQMSVRRALDRGLRFRPLVETARDTLN